MVKIPVKQKRLIAAELKRFIPVIHNLAARGKSSSEDDARIVLNDILNDVLGFDKYNELRTELREKNGRFDYVVKLSDGPNAKKADKFDFVIEAKAIHVELSIHHINQTLAYCLSKSLDYFVLTNVMKWQLFKVKRTKNDPDAILIHEIDFNGANDPDSLADEFYVFSKSSYLANDWNTVAVQAKATSVGDVAAAMLSDKVIRLVCRILEENHGTKVLPEIISEIVENKIIKTEITEINKTLLKKINKPQPPKKKEEHLKRISAQNTSIISGETTPDIGSEQFNKSTGDAA